MSNEFGKYVELKRREKGFTLRGFADMTEIAPAYMSDIEKGHRPAPSQDKLEMIALKLGLTVQEKNILFDFAGATRGKNSVSPDLPEYIMDESLPSVRVALRLARDEKFDNSVWQEVIKILEDKKKTGG